jgi:hypothetical protein
MSGTANLQDAVFQIIMERYPRRGDAVDALTQVLHVGRDGVYRRMRGDTFLSPQELATLSQHYHISLDALVNGQSDLVLCNFNAFSNQISDFSHYLSDFIARMEQLRRLPNVHLNYATVEIPVFTYNFIPELICFKLYVWGRTTWNLEFLRNRPFDLKLVTPPVVNLSQTLLHHYLAMDSTELWSVNIVDNTLAQIEYHVYSGGFRDPQEALILCDKLLEWAEHMKAIASVGKKFRIGEKPAHGLGTLNLFHNEMVHTNNTAIFTSDLGDFVFAAFCNPNFIHSTDKKLCTYTETWFKSVIAKSSPITQASEKTRDWFFKELTRKVERVRQRIQLHIES